MWSTVDRHWQSLRKPGIGAILCVTRSGKLLLAGFFSVKLRAHQLSWYHVKLKHRLLLQQQKYFVPYIVIISMHPYQAFEKWCWGEFLASPHVSAFLSTVRCFHASVKHVAGASILPLDFTSQNAPDCEDAACQVCNFVRQAQSLASCHVTTVDIVGQAFIAFMSRTAWLSIQSDRADLPHTYDHLRQGTRLSKKVTNTTNEKCYLSVATIAKDGLLVVEHETRRLDFPLQLLSSNATTSSF